MALASLLDPNMPRTSIENTAVGPGHPDYAATVLPKIKPPPGMPDPINTPYQRNEDLDLTNRANVMQEYKNWRMGGHGSRMQTADMRGGMQFMGEEMAPGSSTGFGDFRKFLDTFGIRDRLTDTSQYMSVKDPPQTKLLPPSGPPGGITPLPSPPIGGPPGIIPPGSDQIIDQPPVIKRPPVDPYAPSNPVLERTTPPGGRMQMPPGGWGPPKDIFGIKGMGEQLGGFGETLGGYGEQLGGFGEQLGGYKDLLSGFGDKFGSFGEKLGGFKDQFSGINDKLQGLEQGIASLTDKFGAQQQQQQRPQQNYMNPFGFINPYTPFFGGLGTFLRRY